MKLFKWFLCSVFIIGAGMAQLILNNVNDSSNDFIEVPKPKHSTSRSTAKQTRAAYPPQRPFPYRRMTDHHTRFQSMKEDMAKKIEKKPTFESPVSWNNNPPRALDRWDHAKTSYGYAGGHGEGYPHGPTAMYYVHADKDLSAFKPLIWAVVIPLALILTLATVLALVRSPTATRTLGGLIGQQQQQQESNNNNNANNNNNNDNVIVANSGFPFIIIINATGRANEERRIAFKNPFESTSLLE